MNIIVASLLYNLLDYGEVAKSEEEVFWLFASLFQNYSIDECFTGDLERIFELNKGLEMMLFQREQLLFNFINSEDVF